MEGGEDHDAHHHNSMICISNKREIPIRLAGLPSLYSVTNHPSPGSLSLLSLLVAAFAHFPDTKPYGYGYAAYFLPNNTCTCIEDSTTTCNCSRGTVLLTPVRALADVRYHLHQRHFLGPSINQENIEKPPPLCCPKHYLCPRI